MRRGGLALLLSCASCTVVGSLDEFQSGIGQCLRPDAKRYTYVGRGEMAIELDSPDGMGGMGGMGAIEDLSLAQDLGPEMPVEVTHDDACCWIFKIALSENRADTVTYCSTDDGRIEKKGEVQLQGWELGVGKIESTTTIECETGDVVRPSMTPGEQWTHLCSGATDLVAGDYFSNTTWRYDGTESLAVGGTQVDAHRYLEKRVFSGSSSGMLDATVWIAQDNGQPLKTTSAVELVSDTDFGIVTYSESAEWTAESR